MENMENDEEIIIEKTIENPFKGVKLNKTRFIVFVVFMVLVWSSIWLLFYLKADEITRHACSICAEQSGENVQCFVDSPGKIPTIKTFHPNGSESDNIDVIKALIADEFDKAISKDVFDEYNFSQFIP